MTEKRFTIICDDNTEFIMQTKLLLPIYDNKERLSLKTCYDLLNELHEENEFLKSNYKDLVQFVKSKGYTLKEFISFIGQFQNVGVNKEDWE